MCFTYSDELLQTLQCSRSALDRACAALRIGRLGASHGSGFELFSVNDRRTFVGLLHVLPLNGANLEAFMYVPDQSPPGLVPEAGLLYGGVFPFSTFFYPLDSPI